MASHSKATGPPKVTERIVSTSASIPTERQAMRPEGLQDVAEASRVAAVLLAVGGVRAGPRYER